MFAKLLEDILTSDGYRATSAANGVEALALLANEAFDLVMIDIRMPELDGPSFYRELERRNPDQARRVMFMPGGAVRAETAELLSTAPTPVLRTPLHAAHEGHDQGDDADRERRDAHQRAPPAALRPDVRGAHGHQRERFVAGSARPERP